MSLPLRVGYPVLLLVTAIGLVGCDQFPSVPPQTPRSEPKSINLTGIWQVEFESSDLAVTVGPYTWQLDQEGATVTVSERTFPDDPCGEYEESKVEGNRWHLEGSFNPMNCPGLDPLAGTLALDAVVSNTAFTGDLALTLTAPANLAGTYKGRVSGTRVGEQ